MIKLPNITYNVSEALEYYEAVKKDFQHLKWAKNEWLEFINPNNEISERDIDSFFQTVTKNYPHLNRTREDCIAYLKKNQHRELTKDATFWLIQYSELAHTKITNELCFGFAKKILKHFPDAFNIELIVNPPGTKYGRHVDEDDAFRIIIPIIADSGAVWHFDHESNVTTPPGHAYLLVKHKPHATDNLGDSDRVTIAFLLDRERFDSIIDFRCHI